MAIAVYLPTCSKNVPGNRYQFFVTEIANITSITETSNKASTVTMNGSGTFKKALAAIDSIQYTSDGTFTTKGGETQNLIVKLNGRSTELETFKAALIDGVVCGLALIWIDNNGRAWLLGANAAAKDGTSRPVNSLQCAFDSGTLITDDASMYTLTFSKLGAYAPIEFDSTLTAGILAGSSAFISWS